MKKTWMAALALAVLAAPSFAAELKPGVAVTFKKEVSRMEVAAFLDADVSAGMRKVSGPNGDNMVVLQLPANMDFDMASQLLKARDFNHWILSIDHASISDPGQGLRDLLGKLKGFLGSK